MRFNFVGLNLFALGIASSLLGCSSSTSGAGDGGAEGMHDAARTGDDAVGGGSKGGRGKDAGAGSAKDADTTSDHDLGSADSDQGTSEIAVSQAFSDTVGYDSVVFAFIDHHSASGLTCKQTTSGPCEITDCADVDAGATLDDNAGTITISGGSLASSVTLMRGSDGAYGSDNETSQVFAAGNTFTVKASGGTFPAFSGASAAAPGAVTITAPSSTLNLLNQAVYALDITQDLTWTWTGGSAGSTVAFNVVNLDTNLTIVCSFDASGGTGTIPKDVAAKFPTGTATLPMPLVIYSSTSRTISVGSSSVSFVIDSINGSAAFSTQ
jgi:hypothetical protein